LKPVLEEAREKLAEIVAAHGLGEEAVRVEIGTLTSHQAIGDPRRRDYPLLEGREVMVEAQFRGCAGQAFTDRPHAFAGSLNAVLGLDFNSNENRAVFVATLNAVMAHLGLATGTRHCRNEEPEECAAEIASYLKNNSGAASIGLIGLQPAILENLVATFGAANVRCTDLNTDNIGQLKYGAEIWDGRTQTDALIAWGDRLLVTSSALVNNTFDAIREGAAARGKRLVTFGVTGAGVAELLGMERVCFRAH
jgi:hypothetical protein